MTEYWVSQGNKWCDQCKIFIANNPVSIRTHELGQRHRDNVAKRLAAMRKENAAKEKEKQQTIKALTQIEAKAKRSYAKDLAATSETNAESVNVNVRREKGDEWKLDESSGYYYNEATNYYYDPNSGLYYSDIIGKWMTQEEALQSSHSSFKKPDDKIPPATEKSIPSNQSTSNSSPALQVNISKANGNTKTKGVSEKIESGPPPGPVLPASKVWSSSVQGAPSSLAVTNKRKREDKPRNVSKEEAAAIAAREAARKRVQEREKPLLGLYNAY